MMKVVFPIFVLLLLLHVAYAQTAHVAEIVQAKSKIEALQKEWLGVDADQRREIKELSGQSMQKGEFETTAQFQERTKGVEKRVNEIELEILRKTGPRRERLQEQIDAIARTEFVGEVSISLERYDADKQLFSISSKDRIPYGFLHVPLADAPNLKSNFSEAKANGKVAILLDEDNKGREYILTANVTFRDKTYQAVPIPFDQVRAMQMAFGNYSLVRKGSYWKTYRQGSWSNSDEEYILARVQASVLLFKPFRENSVEKFLLVANTEINKSDDDESSCHVCYGLPSIAVFSNQNGYWRVGTVQKHGGEIGYYGSPGTPSLVKIGPDKFGLKFTWGDQGMGYVTSGEYLWRIDGVFPREILNIYTFQDNSESDGPIKDRLSYRSTVTFIPGSNPEFYNVKVTANGRRAVKVGARYSLKPFSKTELYGWENGRFRLVSK